MDNLGEHPTHTPPGFRCGRLAHDDLHQQIRFGDRIDIVPGFVERRADQIIHGGIDDRSVHGSENHFERDVHSGAQRRSARARARR